MKALTVRGVTPALSRALEREKKRRGTSLNQTVLDLLAVALGISDAEPRSNGLAKLAGGWSQIDLNEFEAATAIFDQVDEELWQ
ncbi:MAG: hypothetical protein JRI23_22655 [Deltaproteobacteria bacterium]|jgi:hypothetical protein|nr:hypothetical protein [Deltaproteobacteria bacterium]MBW2534769.1 hypothetical protein [Deltaproteobacteria bacterium]